MDKATRAIAFFVFVFVVLCLVSLMGAPGALASQPSGSSGDCRRLSHGHAG